VAIRLNNLATLLQATNRLEEAEPSMRRNVVIFLKVTKTTGHAHPHLKTAFGNYAILLGAMNRGQDEVVRKLLELGKEAGFARLVQQVMQ
jgi:hypothetical protein